MELKTFKTEAQFIEESLSFVKNICENDKNYIGLSGGSTPKAIYQGLSKLELPNTEFYQVDERCVKKNHPDSNDFLIAESLRKPFHHFDTDLTIPEALEKYAGELPEIFDLMILGIGPDGHTASLFPGSPALKEMHEKTAYTTTTKFTVRDRLTLTFPVILKSKKLLVIICQLVQELQQKEVVKCQ